MQCKEARESRRSPVTTVGWTYVHVSTFRKVTSHEAVVDGVDLIVAPTYQYFIALLRNLRTEHRPDAADKGRCCSCSCRHLVEKRGTDGIEIVV